MTDTQVVVLALSAWVDQLAAALDDAATPPGKRALIRQQLRALYNELNALVRNVR